MPTKKIVKIRQLSRFKWEWWTQVRSWPDGTNEPDINSPISIPVVCNRYGYTYTRRGALRQARKVYAQNIWETIEQTEVSA